MLLCFFLYWQPSLTYHAYPHHTKLFCLHHVPSWFDWFWQAFHLGPLLWYKWLTTFFQKIQYSYQLNYPKTSVSTSQKRAYNLPTYQFILPFKSLSNQFKWCNLIDYPTNLNSHSDLIDINAWFFSSKTIKQGLRRILIMLCRKSHVLQLLMDRYLLPWTNQPQSTCHQFCSRFGNGARAWNSKPFERSIASRAWRFMPVQWPGFFC